jgi:hypothetical protein
MLLNFIAGFPGIYPNSNNAGITELTGSMGDTITGLD